MPILISLSFNARPRRSHRKAVELAKAGDLTAIRICMDRIVPARGDRHVIFELPKIETPADGVRACSALLETVAGWTCPGFVER